MRMRCGFGPALLGLALALALLPGGRAAAQETCSPESFGEAVDASAAELRAFSAEAQPKLRQKLATLRDRKQWTDPDFEAKGLALVHDKKLDQFDAEASDLLSKIDTLGSPETDTDAVSCANLSDLKAASSELIAVMRAKSAYLIARLDQEIGAAPAAPQAIAKVEEANPAPAPAAPSAPTPATPAATPAPVAPSASTAAPEKPAASNAPAAEPYPDLSPIRRTEKPKAEPSATAPIPPSEEPDSSASIAPAPVAKAPETKAPEIKPAEPKASAPGVADTAKAPKPTPEPKSREGVSEPTSSWSTTTAQAVVPPPVGPAARHDAPPPAYDAPQAGVPYELPPGEPPPPGSEAEAGTETFDPTGGGYSIDEIREATRGFFGTVSTSLASVIEHAFKKSGRPTAYVLGNEGGGAFLAGLRYGEGTLYLRNGGSQKVYWHGPSIGYDLGAEGSRTLFLIYSLNEPDGLFRQFTGVDGSAYLVGGVGMTLLKGGEVVMAPIRSGLGLRLGASIGYVRFTPRPTWNPF